MVIKHSKGYYFGRLLGRAFLIGVAFIFGKRWGQQPMDKSFPKK